MTEEQIKAKAKEQFPNDEFKQQIVIDAIIWATKELEKENAELMVEWQEQVQKATDEGYARTLQTMQLNKAKEIIRELVEKVVWFDNCFDLKAEAEQFISEVEK